MAKYINWNELQKLINFERFYIRYGGKLTRASKGLYKVDCLCPFHEDKTPGTLYVNINTGMFHCFSCGKSGNLPKFISHSLNISYIEALEILESEVLNG